ncbi:phosphatidylinositol 3 and 4-kinase-domain-containing protein [Schizophyllum amplum]|uniref:Phosphatidylinositol 4-kinase n=1 Tax=Schizophyllum amplum TaxID=97359 RepID=A0A550CYC1_9AGAR|nr:phosphatidylinositol 3 and 4-kinase-domain-containing protein [Auriculariopsis ampla]
MAPRSGYQPLAQAVDDDDALSDEEASLPSPSRRGRRRARPGSIDLKKLDNAFKRWTESIAQKVKRKKKASGHQRRQIWRSVFEPYVPPAFEATGPVKTLDHQPPMSQVQFNAMVQAVKDAIAEGTHPKMIAKGSSGSYFARAKDEMGRVRTVAVFKPKDEEPYGRLNPKTTKWLHRQLRWIIPFGRACLIPNLSYVSEAAASLLDTRLKLHIVPPTQLVSFSSPAFFYDWIDRNAARKGKPLPDKIGSMQVFMNGFQDASDFLRKHPWPGRTISDTFDDSNHRRSRTTKRFLSAVKIVCGRTGEEQDLDDDEEEDRLLFDGPDDGVDRPFYWSQALQQSFRAELEKLVILDYLMQNTDRGADNYMIKYCDGAQEKSLVDVPPSRSSRSIPQMSEVQAQPTATPRMEASASRQNNGPLSTSSDCTRRPHIHIAAIDNSLSFPHEHPQGWRSYTYGWLYLPVSIIGKPFSAETRNHFLPLLTSKTWWEETTHELEKLFAVDEGFHPKMFARQLAVIKGQAYNIVQSLKHSDEGPLELTRRKKVMVWDDEIDVPEAELDNPAGDAIDEAQGLPSPHMSVYSVPLPRRTLSISSADFPPPMMRTSTDASGAPRPVSFAAKIQRVHPGTTGVTMLEHLERLDAVEASLQRLGVDEDVIVEEDDVGDRPPTQPQVLAASQALAVPAPRATVSSSLPVTSFSPPSSPPMPTLHEAEAERSIPPESDDEADVVAMSKSMSHADSPLHTRWSSSHQAGPSRAIEWADADAESLKTVINERLEVVEKKPLLSCW